MVLTWPTIKYPFKIVSILGIFTTNYLIPPMDAKLMGRHSLMREGDDSLRLRAFPEENTILAHYMLSEWWLNLMDGMGHYIILPGALA